MGKSSPTEIEALKNVGVKKVCAGTQFSVILTKAGQVYSFGQVSPHHVLKLSHVTAPHSEVHFIHIPQTRFSHVEVKVNNMCKL